MAWTSKEEGDNENTFVTFQKGARTFTHEKHGARQASCGKNASSQKTTSLPVDGAALHPPGHIYCACGFKLSLSLKSLPTLPPHPFLH